jgi:hypothetical protein
MAPPPLHPRRIPGFSSYLDEQGWGFAALGSLCPPGVAPHYRGCSAWWMSSLHRDTACSHSVCTLRIANGAQGDEGANVSPATARTRMRSCWKQFRDRSRGKNCDERFQDFDFFDFAIVEISNFANLDFCIFPRSARPSSEPPPYTPPYTSPYAPPLG